jgi:hypothetical protein
MVVMRRRTTVMIDVSTLATLQAEADRRRTSLAAVLREAADAKASAVSASHRPRVGYGRSTDGGDAAGSTSDPVAEQPR